MMNAPDNLAHIAALRAHLADAGFRPVALKTGDKMPLMREWQDRARRDPPADAVEPVRPDHANTGILCDGLRVVDLDVDDADIVANLRALALDMLGTDALIRTRPNSPRCALIYRAAEGEPLKRSISGAAGKIEILGKGQQLHAFGRHPSGADLAWYPEPPGGAALESLPPVTEAQIGVFLDEALPLIGAAAGDAKANPVAEDRSPSSLGMRAADDEDIAAVLAAIPNNGPANWDHWNRVGLAIFGATGGSEAGREAWHEWSAKNPAYNAKTTEARWRGIRRSPPNRIGTGTLMHLAGMGMAGASFVNDPGDTNANSNNSATAGEWPDVAIEAVVSDTTPPPDLPLAEIFPSHWAEWITLKAELKGTTQDYIAGTVLAVAGGLLGNVRWAEAGDDWREPPAIRVANVGAPSQGKSQGQSAVTDILAELQAAENTDWDERVREHKTRKAEATEKATQWQADMKVAVKEGHAPPLMPEGAAEPKPPQKRRIYSTNPTVASAERLSEANPRGMILGRDELAGWIASMDQFNATAGADRAFWLESYNGGHHSPDRKGDGETTVNVPHVTWAVVGTIQPDRMARLLLGGDDDGMAARFIYVWPASVPLVRARRGLIPPPALEWLRRLRQLPWNPPDPIGIPFTDAAEELLFEWRQAVRDMEAEASGLFLSWLGKLPGFAVRLALVFAYLEWCCTEHPGPEPDEVRERDILRALRFLEDYAVPMARRCFGEAALPQAEADARRLARWMLKQRPIPEKVNAKTLRRMAHGPGIPDAARMTAALEELAGLGVVRRVAPSGKGGRTPADYEVNPTLRGAGQ